MGFSWFAFKMCFTNSFGVENIKNPTPKKIQREDVWFVLEFEPFNGLNKGALTSWLPVLKGQ